MAEEQEEITVKVEDVSEGHGSEGTETGKTDTVDPVAELKAQYDELQAQQKQEQEARRAAEVRERQANEAARQAAEEARSARTEATDTRLSSIDQAILAAKSAADAANTEYQTALEAGDWKRAADAQRKLARAEAQTVQYEQNKVAWENYKPTPQPQKPAGDPIDNYINQVAQQTPNSANWLRQHRDWVTDPKKNAKLTAAHHDAVSELGGGAVDTPEYFAHVERFIGLTKPEPVAPSSGNGQEKPARRSSAAAAPVAPVVPSPGGTSGGGTEVRLSKQEAASATDGTLVWNYNDPTGQNRFKKGDPIGIQEMARRKKAMKDQGWYDKMQYEAS